LAAVGVDDDPREHRMNDRPYGDDDLSFEALDLSFEALREYGRDALRIATTRR